MKFTIEQEGSLSEPEIIIRAAFVDKRLQKIIDCIRQYSFSLEGETEEGLHPVPADNVYYAESVDGKTYFYTEKDTYRYRKTLQELESELKNTPFVRIGKSCLLNTEYLKCVRPQVNHRLEAILKNDEKLIVSRNYVNELKEKLKRR